ncbi:MAG: diguanylate cyclase [Anaerotignum sp.]|nr:diguanylate cyclase [Anaerotignum sp.]
MKKINSDTLLLTYSILAMALILLIGLLYSYYCMNHSKIGSDSYEEIMLSNELTADILPPPEYIVESYASALEYIYIDNQSRREELYSQILQFEDSYNIQHEFWVDNLPDYDNLRQVVLVESYKPAQRFYQIFFYQVVPAVASNNQKAIEVARLNLQNVYNEHSQAIEKCVVTAEQWRNMIFNSSNELAERNDILMKFLILAFFILCIIFCIYTYYSEKKLLHMAYYDSLTMLPNRKRLIEKLEHRIRSKKHFSFVIFDLDGFKKINDSFGHIAGDTLLQEISNILMEQKHPNDLLGRLGGDEFALMIDHGSDYMNILEYIENLRKTLPKSVNINQSILPVSASFGIASFPEDASTAKELITYADLAMYYAKKTGGNNVQRFHSELQNKDLR